MLARERERIGRDLHDGLGQQLVGIALICGDLERRAAAGEPAGPPALRRLRRAVEDATRQLAALSRAMLPFDSEAGLARALATLARSVGELGTPCEARIDPRAAPDDPAVGAELYRIAQEALANAARHAGARTIVIDLARSGAGAVLRVRDDGRGGAAAASRGLGLRIMAERARAIGAELEILERPGGGTEVRCTLLPSA